MKKNPFVVIGYQGPDYFCDRVRETEKILDAIENDRNLTLIAPRRYGKTGLIHHVFARLPTHVIPLYVDIFATRNLSEFTNLFVSTVVGTLDSPLEKTLGTLTSFFKSCRPTITPQSDGKIKFSFDIEAEHAATSLREAFAYLKSRKQRVVIAIDEFQQILNYPEKGVEALLRGFVQEAPNVRFVFAGSHHHLMGEMFLSAKHPFYQSTDILSLTTIDAATYAAFAARFFKARRFSFDAEAFSSLYQRFDGITWYVQMVLNRLWARGAGFTTAGQLEDVVRELVEDRAIVFRDLFFSQNEIRQKLLVAIAAEGVAPALYSGAFIRRHSLSATSTVRSTAKILEENDLIYKTERGYIVYDYLFAQWLRQRL